MEWNIVADSGCDLRGIKLGDKKIKITKIPFSIFAENIEYMDNPRFNVGDMLHRIEKQDIHTHTACPSPAAWKEAFDQGDHIFAITLSSKVSGSYNSAQVAAAMVQEEDPEKKIHILDSGSAGPGPSLLAIRAAELMEEGVSFADAVMELEDYKQKIHTMYGLSSFNNLIKNGRVSKVAGFVAGKLGLCGIGEASPQGEILVQGKVRGSGKMLAAFLERMEELDFQGGKVLISHCENQTLAKKLKEMILKQWPQAEILIMPAAGVCSYYVERKGLIVGFE